MLLFSVVPMLLLYLIQRVQGFLPLNPQKFAAVPPDLAFNTAASFTTNTNWQNYSGEATMSYLTQMAGLAYHNFTSAAVGIALAIAFIRGIARRQKETIGNFWVDMTRATLWVLLPICVVGALLLVSQGVVQNLRPYDKATLVESAAGAAPGRRRQTRRRRQRQAGDGHRDRADHRARAGRVAGGHQAVRHERRRLLQRQQRPPVREPNAVLQLHRDVRDLRHLRRTDLHARPHDGLATPWLGGVVCHGDSFPVRRHRRLLG